MTLPLKILIEFNLEKLKQSTSKTIESISDIVNKGYEKAVLKYKVVQSPRIHAKNLLFHDLGFIKNDDKCFFYVMMTEDVLSDQNFNNMFALSNCDTKNGILRYTPKSPITDYSFPFEYTMATVGYKLLGCDDYEMTGFTSFFKGEGIAIFQSSLKQLAKNVKLQKLVARVIVEHELVSYYEQKLGFIETKRIFIEKAKVESIGFEKGFLCTKDFHMSNLVKSISVE